MKIVSVSGLQHKKSVLVFVFILSITSLSILRISDSHAGSPFLSPLPFMGSSSAIISKSTVPKHSEWMLPDIAPSPDNNPMNAQRVELGKMLFFDPRLSGTGQMSCATCHDPRYGWSDGRPTAKGHNGKVLGRATPTIINTGFSKILMWDGRAASLEEQSLGPINNPDEMANTTKRVIKTLKQIPGYVKAFNNAYHGLGITKSTIQRSIAMFQRTVVANNSPFDKWIAGDESAMTEQQVRGFKIFTNPEKGNCAVCHQAPNFTDNGFHNIGLASFGEKNPDLGRYNQKPVNVTKGAFKTPPLKNIAETAPYFHDGSAKTLEDVIDHYVRGGSNRDNLSPNLKVGRLNSMEKDDLVAFLKALTSEMSPTLAKVSLP